jgi:adenylate cyclase
MSDTGETTHRAEPTDLRALLGQLGVPAAEVERAVVDGTLELLALEKVMAVQPPRFDVDDVAALSGVEPDQIRAYWRALGFPDPPPGEKIFGQDDVELLGTLMSFINEGSVETDLALQMARVIGSAMAKVANAHVESLDGPRRTNGTSTGRGVPTSRDTEALSIMPRVMESVWRRQLAAAARRRLMRAAGQSGADGVVVGFADLVGFTAKTQQLAEDELAEVVGRFEAVAFDLVAGYGGRVIKMIGDEVMFLHEDVRTGAELALALASRFRDDPALSDVRVGLASGTVLERDGDVYGHVVNLANRIVSFAYPGSVVVDTQVHDALVGAGDTGMVLRSLGAHELKNIGQEPLWVLRRAEEYVEVPYQREQARRASRFLRAQWAELQRRSEEVPGGVPGLTPELLGAVEPEMVTGQLEAITEAVLGADIDADMQVTLLGDLEIARRLQHLEQEAASEVAEADREALARVEEIEREARARVDEIERAAHGQVEQVLDEAETSARLVREEANRRADRMAEDLQLRAEKVAREAKADAERLAIERRGGTRPDPG